jgi:hypothetical protein
VVDLSLPSGRRLRLRVRVQGIPALWSDDVRDDLDVPSVVDGILDFRGSIHRVEESETRIDTHRRTQVGGGLTITVSDTPGLGSAGKMRDLFAPRRQRVAYLRADIDDGDTSANIGSTTGVVNSPLGVPYAWIGAETVHYSAVTGSTLGGLTRGALDSDAQSHSGGSEQGASVFAQPPWWYGRRVYLEGYEEDQRGEPQVAATWTPLGTYRLEEAPAEVSPGKWELRCSHLCDELGRRKIGAGLDEIEMPDDRIHTVEVVDGVQVLRVQMDGHPLTEGKWRAFTQGALPSHALITFVNGYLFEGEEATTILPIYEVDDDAGDVLLRCTPLTDSIYGRPARMAAFRQRSVAGGVEDGQQVGYRISSIKHIAVMDRATPSTSLLWLLTSRLGDGTNGALTDVLGGYEAPNLGEGSFRLGAGIEDSEIDVNSLEQLANSAPGGWHWVVDGEQPVEDVVRDFCMWLDAVAVFDNNGQLAFRRVTPDDEPSITLTEDDAIGDIAATLAEQDVFARAKVSCNYNPLTEDYEATVDVLDVELARAYRAAEDAIVIESRSLTVRPLQWRSMSGTLARESIPPESLLPLLRRQMLAYRGGKVTVQMRLPVSYYGLGLADVVGLTLPTIPDYAGGTIDGRARVVAIQRDWEAGHVSVALEMLLPVYRFAASAEVASVTGSSPYTLTLSTGDDMAADSAFPATAFRVGDVVAILREGTGEVGTGTLTGVTGTLVVGSYTGSAPLADDIVAVRQYVSGLGASVDGRAQESYAFAMPADEGTTTAHAVTRWS